MGPGMVIDIEHLNLELRQLAVLGAGPGKDGLVISDRATICMPYDKLQDGLEEDRLADRKFGSTRRGIAPVYADKYMKKALRMGDLLHPEGLKERLRDIVEWKKPHAPLLRRGGRRRRNVRLAHEARRGPASAHKGHDGVSARRH